ncbi:MAG TPA: 2-phosphosulfolactate phosphatase [Gemmatimonadales bacterium]|nr:2-phosphosulfolactate phosphatase [Gemmatimonadales bacterium]
MKLDVVFTPLGLPSAEIQGRTLFVIDILRATTTICAALTHGARAVIPVAETDEALRLAQTLDSADVVLAGERQTLPIPGFPLGNSPREMTPEAVRGKTIILTTTNGTRAILATQGAAAVYPMAAANLTAAGQRAREVWERDRDLVILCAGRDGHFALDDAYAAGRLVMAALGTARRRRGLNDAALATLDLVRRYGLRWERPLAFSQSGRALADTDLQADILDAAREDAYPVLAQYHERRVTLVQEAA